MYSGTAGQATWVQGDIVSAAKPSVLLGSSGAIFGKGHPQYADYATSQIISVKSQGATGDGTTDDTAAIQNVFNEVMFMHVYQLQCLLYLRSCIVCWLHDHLL